MKKAIKQGLVILSLIVFYNLIFFQVDETERAVILQLGNPVWETDKAGLYIKLPWPIQSVVILDKRLIKYDASPREIITSDKKIMVIDTFAYFRIENGIRYLQRTQTIANAQARMDDVAYSEIRNDLGARSFEEILITYRNTIMDKVTVKTSKQISEYGLETRLVRMNRADLPLGNKKSVYKRMAAERNRQSMKYRSEGDEEARKIRAETDKEVQIILAEAGRTAQENKGNADGEAARIYNEVYNKDPEFFKIYRGLESAKITLGSGGEISYIFNGNEPHIREFFGKK